MIVTLFIQGTKPSTSSVSSTDYLFGSLLTVQDLYIPILIIGIGALILITAGILIMRSYNKMDFDLTPENDMLTSMIRELENNKQ